MDKYFNRYEEKEEEEKEEEEEEERKCEIKRYWIILAISVIIFIAEITGSYFSKSLALWGDAWHVLLDNVAIFISLHIAYRVRVGKKSEEEIRRQGSIENAILLLLIGVIVIYKSFARLYSPPEIELPIMIPVAVFGGLGNFFQYQILKKVKKNSGHRTHKWLAIHIFFDFLQSIAVIICTVVVIITGEMIIDLLASIAIGIFMLLQAIIGLRKIFKNSPQTISTKNHEHEHTKPLP